MTHERPVGATIEWYTPPQIFTALGLRFDLDPASPIGGPVPWIPAEKFYSPSDNGLRQLWEGLVWLNPPYGPAGVDFIRKMVDHMNGVMLVPARTETRIFQHAATWADAVCFLRDRLHYIREDGFQARAAFGSVLMGFGKEAALAVLGCGLGLTFCDEQEVSEIAA